MYRRVDSAMRADGASSSSLLLLLLLFAASFPVSYYVGQQGPTMRLSKVSNASFGGDTESRWVEDLGDMDRSNQEFSLYTQLNNKHFAVFGVDLTIEVDVTLWGSNGDDGQFSLLTTDEERQYSVSCPMGEPLCRRIRLLREPSIEWNRYRAVVNMRGLTRDNDGVVVYTFEYGNPMFTNEAMVVKYAFLLLAAQRALSFAMVVSRDGDGHWDADRRMTMVLLVGLSLFNDPLYVLRLLWGGPLFPLVALIGQLTYCCCVALFVLVSLDRILDKLKSLSSSYELESSRGSVAAKVLVVGSLWAGQVLVLLLVGMNQAEDPMYRASVDLGGFLTYKLASLCLVSVTLGWFFYIVLRTMGELSDLSRTVGVHMRESPEVSGLRQRFFFITGMTILLIASVVVSLVAWYLGVAGLPGDNAAEFLAFSVFLNLYGLIMAWGTTPTVYGRIRSDDDHL